MSTYHLHRNIYSLYQYFLFSKSIQSLRAIWTKTMKLTIIAGTENISCGDGAKHVVFY